MRGGFTALIEKILALDTSRRYRIVTCGEEVHRQYWSKRDLMQHSVLNLQCQLLRVFSKLNTLALYAWLILS